MTVIKGQEDIRGEKLTEENRYRIGDGEQLVWGLWVESTKLTVEDDDWEDGVFDPHLC